MRKSMFLPIVLSLCIVQIGAFAAPATRGNARGVNIQNQTQPAEKSTVTRSATRTATKNTQTNQVSVGRSAAKPVSSPKTTAARAASTQKVINNGTKVATATANTVIDQECQDGFYGCMDSFCMIDNASGGRCQCSNRNDELLKVMDDIATLDEQSYAMATEGVERIQMGEDAEAIIARAKAAGDKVTGKAEEELNKKKARKLDLSAWNQSVFSEETEDLFESVEFSTTSVSDAMSKTGAELYNNAAKLCVAQMPTKCSGSLNMLQSVYAQKIKSDCIAFENSLKQQKIVSTQKLQAAEKALRDASLEKFREENKYATTGECVSAYAQCMEDECGHDYSKCIQFAAEENIKGSTVKEKNRTIKGIVDIILSGATMTQLMSKKTVCDGNVLKYCVNHRSEVWDKYLEYVAPTLKSAEVNAEDNLRQNCIKDLATCFQGACAAEFDPNKDEASYDMCLSDPMLVVDFCKVKLDACIVVTGGTGASEEGVVGSRLWNGISALLNAMRVDTCTREVKSGIEAICGENFVHCVGMNPGTIAELLPTDTLTACMEKNNRDRNKILQYVAEIAQGYALQINDKMYEVCQIAAQQAMISVCGNSTSCDSLNLGNMSFDALLDVKLCKEEQKKEEDGYKLECKNVNDFTEEDIVKGLVRPHILNRINVNSIVYNVDLRGTVEIKNSEGKTENVNCATEGVFDKLSPEAKLQCYKGFTYELPKYYDEEKKEEILYGAKNGNQFADPDSPEVRTIISGLTNLFNNKMSVMLKDKTVHDCMYGKSVTGFNSQYKSSTSESNGKITTTTANTTTRSKTTIGNPDESVDTVYSSLLDSYKEVLISKSLELLKQKYDKAEKDLQPQIDALNNELSQRLSNIEGVKAEEIHQSNKLTCAQKAMRININNNTVGNQIPDMEVDKESGVIKISEKTTKTAFFGDVEFRLGACGDSGFCFKGEELFFDTGVGRNKFREALYWTEASYDETTSKCTLTTMKYDCTKWLTPYCWSWNTTGVQDDVSVEQMPRYNRQKMLNDYNKTGDGNNGGAGNKNNGWTAGETTSVGEIIEIK